MLVEVGRFIPGTRNDERRARFVNEDRVDLVHNGKDLSSLHHVLFVNDHIVAQVVEAELVVRSIGNVRAVSRLLFLFALRPQDKPRGQSQILIDAPHFLGADARKVLVDRDDVHALARERVEICRHGGNERFAFTGLHLRNATLMQDDTAEHLHAERAFAQHAVGGFSDRGKSLGQNVVGRLAIGKARAELVCHAAQFLFAHGAVGIGERVNLVCKRSDFFQLLLAVASKERRKKSHFQKSFRGV